ncbi:uncharacterized protein DUF397 [Stackebrandtia endophytica]|uniref:Uncharacterized protein DUF397 n=1 Tax=Stackebrandtia endophytica TaxID=1496996 RepID=A0A543AV85_9ACTN|nr:DUF397 domain-containing protein [Stackebrandtia endophytica]TQL76500.1 uncharacterized protein DUF397 [Stackebrandtia endophytica]
MIPLTWRKSSRSNNNGNCVEVGCLHDAVWRKSSRSSNNGNCVEVAPVSAVVAVRDSKLDTTGDFPYLTVSAAEWSTLLTTIRTGDLSG